VKVAYIVPVADGPKIVYPVALVKDSAQADAAKKFLEYLASDSAAKVFRQFGFMVLEKSASGQPIRVAQTASLLYD
jgi:molybdate transport system substrate-binding protein